MGGAREGIRSPRFIADVRVDQDIRHLIVESRCVLLGGGRCHDLRRQRLVFDDDAFGGILCRGKRLGNHEGDGGADAADAIGRQHGMRGKWDRGAVAVLQHDIGRRAGIGVMGDRLEAVGARVLAGQHREHPGHGARRFHVDRADQRMRMGRAHDGREGLAGKVEIVAVAAATGEEAQILLAAYRVSDA